MAQQFLGAVITLVSKSDIRYRGTLVAIDAAAATLSLENVSSLGSEGRKGDPAKEIPPSDGVWEFILFKASDIRDLSIEEQPGPPKPRAQVPDDPAIVNSRQQQQQPGFNNGPPPSMYGPPPGPQSPFMPPYPPYPGFGMQGPPYGQFAPPGGFPPGPPPQMPPPMQQQQQQRPLSAAPQQHQQQQQNNTSQVPEPARTPQQAPNKPAPAQAQAGPVPSKSKPSPQPPAAAPTGPAAQQAQAQQQRAQQPPQPVVDKTPAQVKPSTWAAMAAGQGKPGQQASVTPAQVEALAADVNRTRISPGDATAPNARPNNNRRGGSRDRLANGNSSAPRQQRLPEFDFQSSTAAFEKMMKDSPTEVASTAEPEVYSKSSSFFDNISSDAKERQEVRSPGGGGAGAPTAGGNLAFDRQAEREKNMSTFGQASVSQGPRQRGRGRGGRGRGGPRGRGRGRAAAPFAAAS